MRRVAVTGIGIVSPLGRGRAAHIRAVAGAISGIGWLRDLQPPDNAAENWIGGSVADEWIDEPGGGSDRFVRLALTAAREALEQSGAAFDPDRIGVVIGTGLGGAETFERGYHRFYAKGQSRMPPTTIPRAMYNAATSAISAAWNARGPAWSVVSACTSSTHAIGQALDWIRAGRADVVIAGGSDAPLQPGILRSWEALRVLAPPGDDPASACRPFAADRRGIVISEGAAVLVLEELGHAEKRGATILAEIAGAGYSSDAGHLTDPTAEGPAMAMRAALADAGLAPSAIGYINAHGTATRTNDPTETRAIHAVFGTDAGRLAVSSTKSMHGHAMGASGAIELALSIVSLREGLIPPTLHLETPDPECDLDYVPREARAGKIDLMMSSSFGFGGLNGVVIARIL
jgi:nodulation protein E